MPLKCWVADDCNGLGDTECACQVIAAESRNKARYFAKRNWYYDDIEYIHLNVRRYKEGDEFVKDKEMACEIDDRSDLRSIGFKFMCPECRESFLAGDSCPCGESC